MKLIEVDMNCLEGTNPLDIPNVINTDKKLNECLKKYHADKYSANGIEEYRADIGSLSKVYLPFDKLECKRNDINCHIFSNSSEKSIIAVGPSRLFVMVCNDTDRYLEILELQKSKARE